MSGVASLSVRFGLAHLRSVLDPGFRRRLDAATTAHLLAEVPRVLRLLEAKIDEVRASGCSPSEASIIAYQVVEAQQRTLDVSKRRRLSNVLVSGLCTAPWSRARHQLMVRLASELEEEHILELSWYIKTPDERQAEWQRPDGVWRTIAGGAQTFTPTSAQIDKYDLADVFQRELISRGLLDETPTPRVMRQRDSEYDAVDDVDLDWKREITPIGRAFLEHIKDPEDD